MSQGPCLALLGFRCFAFGASGFIDFQTHQPRLLLRGVCLGSAPLQHKATNRQCGDSWRSMVFRQAVGVKKRAAPKQGVFVLNLDPKRSTPRNRVGITHVAEQCCQIGDGEAAVWHAKCCMQCSHCPCPHCAGFFAKQPHKLQWSMPQGFEKPHVVAVHVRRKQLQRSLHSWVACDNVRQPEGSEVSRIPSHFEAQHDGSQHRLVARFLLLLLTPTAATAVVQVLQPNQCLFEMRVMHLVVKRFRRPKPCTGRDEEPCCHFQHFDGCSITKSLEVNVLTDTPNAVKDKVVHVLKAHVVAVRYPCKVFEGLEQHRCWP
eukprot:m.78144 g.78144  ORF g.78144 m.78144 type:complete len:317 (+) comp14573_c0_seq4:1082-2032(+)